MTVMDKLLSTGEAAAYLGMAEQTLRLWRTQRKGPAFVRVGRLIRYKPDALDTWAARHTSDPEAPPKRRGVNRRRIA